MAFTHEWKDEGVYIRYFDELTSKDLISSNSLLVGKREFEEIKFVIADFSDVTSIDIDNADANVSAAFAIKVNPYNKHIKVALVSNNMNLQPLIETYLENTLKMVPHAQQKLFSDMPEAKDWVES